MKKVIKRGIITSLNIIKQFSIFVTFIIKYCFSRIVYKQQPSKINSIPSNNLLIIGNGPSAEKCIQINNFNGLDLLCVNFFALENSSFFVYKPRFYCLLDPGFFEDTDDRVAALLAVLEIVDWDMLVVIPQKRHLVLQNERIELFYINSIYYSGEWLRTKLVSTNTVNVGFQNVINGALQFAVMSKYREIYLIGVENDWHRELVVDSNNDVYRYQRHFYGETIENITSEGVLKKGELFKYFFWYYRTLLIYYNIQIICEDLGIHVYNLVPDSFIDVFEKIPIIE